MILSPWLREKTVFFLILLSRYGAIAEALEIPVQAKIVFNFKHDANGKQRASISLIEISKCLGH